MLPSTQQKITKALYRVCNDLAPALGRKSLSYSEFMRLVRNSFGPGKMPWSFAQGIAASVLPSKITAADTPSMDVLVLVDTEEKLEAALLSAPEPTAEYLEKALKFINNALPALRGWLSEEAKKLPHDRGGAPRKLASAEEEAKVVEEIKALRGPGKKLEDVFKRIALRHGVSPSKIKQIWLRAAAQSPEGS